MKQGVLNRRTTQVDRRTMLQIVLPPSFRNKAITGCHDQAGHLGQDRVLELLRDQFYWPRIHTDVASYINSCPRCLRRKSQPDQAPVLNIKPNQPLELIHFDYLKIEYRKENIENVLVITDHFTRYSQGLSFKNTKSLGQSEITVE